MSQAGIVNVASINPEVVETLTGNSGGAVPPSGNNINIVGSGAVSVVGNPATNTLTITDSGAVSVLFTEDTGTATPALGNLNIFGTAGQGIVTSGAGSTVTITADNASAIQKGVASFNSTEFTVTAGAVASNAITVTGGTGTTVTGSPVNLGGAVTITASGSVPTTFIENTGSATPSANNLYILGNYAAASSVPVSTTGGTDVVTVVVQTASAIASTNVNNIGLAAFNSADFTVDANGFVSFSGTGAGETITGSSGGSLSPTAGNWNILGTGSITTVGSGSTLTVELTGLTNHAVLIGAGTATITKVGPSATTGQVLQSQGSSTDPAFSTATYPATTTINQLLYSSAANTVTGLATVNDAVLTTTAAGVPTWLSMAGNGDLLIGSAAGAPAVATLTAGTGVTITNAANAITIGLSGSVVTETLTAQSGGALSPTAGNFNIYANGVSASGTSTSGNLITSGSGSTITVNSTEAQYMTNYTNVLVGASPYTALATDYYISCTSSGGAITIKLPNAPTTNRLFIIKDLSGSASTNNISITTVGGSVTIDGLTTYKILSNYGAVNLLFNGTSYEVY